MSQTLKDLSIEDLELDLYNPRLPKSKQGKDEKTVIEFMLLEAATLELMTAIGENGFFAGELLLVVEDKARAGKYTVIEGNRRLTAVKLLVNPKLASVKKIAVSEIINQAKFKSEQLQQLPCLVFQEKNDILKYLGFRHITGIKAWRLLEKARYLYELRNADDFKDLSFLVAAREIAKMIGSSSAYVKRLLASFELYKLVEDEDFYGIDGLNDVRFFLNYFTDGLSKENIRNFIGVDLTEETPLEKLSVENLKEIVHWWFEKSEGQSRVIGDSEGLKVLDAVLGSDVALAAFRKGESITHSYELTGDIDLQFEKKTKEALRAIEQAFVLTHKVGSFYKELYEDLKSIRKLASNINDLKSKTEQDGDEF